MRLGYADVAFPQRVMILPRQEGESGASYAVRFQRAITGLGRIFIVTAKGARIKRRSVRSW